MQALSNGGDEPVAGGKRKGGRPKAAEAGDVDRRILESANRLFLSRGFEATHCEQVAADAGAGKASLYARYASKEDLFTAVVRRNVESMLAQSIDPAPPDAPVRERLGAVGHIILSHAMQPQVVALMRVVISVATRMPEIARLTDSIGRDRGIELAARAIAGPLADSPEAIQRALPAAAKFIDLVFVPYQMRALLGHDLAELASTAPSGIAEAVDLLAASGGLDGWT